MDECDINRLPKYKTVSGNQLPLGMTLRRGFQICIQNTTIQECKAYAEELQKCGFVQYSVKEIPAGTQTETDVNLFYTYVTEDMHVFLSWNAFLKTTRIVVQQPGLLPSVQKPVVEKQDTCVPCIMQIGVSGGMSYVVQLADQSFIVIDGGECRQRDIQYLYKLLSRRTRGKKPVICAWMFTHSHEDHIGLATEFIRRKAQDVDVKSFIYQFPNCEKMNTQENDAKMQRDIALLEKNIADCYPDALVYTLHTGQTYYFKGVEIEILFDAENIYPYKAAHYNDASAAWRMTFDDGKSFLVLGDCFHLSCKQLSDAYGTYLKSDILSVTHHGLIGGNKELYQNIDPDICLWAIREERFLGKAPYDTIQYCLGEGGCDYNAWIRDPSVRKREHYHGSVTTVLQMN